MFLVRKAGLEPPAEMLQFLGKIANGSVPTRYPDDFAELLASCSREVAERYLRSATEVFKWLKDHPNLKE